jgi:hypothetical protein
MRAIPAAVQPEPPRSLGKAFSSQRSRAIQKANACTAAAPEISKPMVRSAPSSRTRILCWQQLMATQLALPASVTRSIA